MAGDWQSRELAMAVNVVSSGGTGREYTRTSAPATVHAGIADRGTVENQVAFSVKGQSRALLLSFAVRDHEEVTPGCPAQVGVHGHVPAPLLGDRL